MEEPNSQNRAYLPRAVSDLPLRSASMLVSINQHRLRPAEQCDDWKSVTWYGWSIHRIGGHLNWNLPTLA
jgi:hypothetical protein